MPIRGERNFMPKKGKAPSGIFSSKGKQKVDSTDHFTHKDAQAYAHGSSTRSKPTNAGSASLRHLKHYGKSHK